MKSIIEKFILSSIKDITKNNKKDVALYGDIIQNKDTMKFSFFHFRTGRIYDVNTHNEYSGKTKATLAYKYKYKDEVRVENTKPTYINVITLEEGKDFLDLIEDIVK